MTYTAKEIVSIKAFHARLVEARQVNIELDAFGDPSPIYPRETQDLLVEAITDLDNFPRACVVENALLEASIHYGGDIFSGFKMRKVAPVIRKSVDAFIADQIYDFAFQEIKESIFTPQEMIAAMQDHPDYHALLQAWMRLYGESRAEMDDSRERVADMRAA